MSETLPGIELLLSSSKAVVEAQKYVAAVESAAQASERLGTSVEKTQSALTAAGSAAKSAGDDMASVGTQARAQDEKVTRLGVASVRSTRDLTAFAATGRGTAAVLRLLSETDAARSLSNITGAAYSAGVAMQSSSAIAGGLGLAIAAASLAFVLFGDNVEETSRWVKQFEKDAKEAESVVRRFDELRLSLMAGEAGTGEQLVKTLREQLVKLKDEMERGVREVPADRVLAAIEQQAPQTVQAIRRVMDQMIELGKEGKQAPLEMQHQFNDLMNAINDRFSVRVRSFTDSTRTSVKGFTVDIPEAVQAVSRAFDILSGKVNASKDALDRARQTVQDLKRGVLPQDDTSTTAKRSEATRKILQDLRDENALLEQQGAERKSLRKEQEVLASLAEQKVGLTSDEHAEAVRLLAIYRDLALADEKRTEAKKEQKREDRLDRRADEAFRQLQREEEQVRLTGTAREKLLRQIQGENDARQAGLVIGSVEYRDYVSRKTAVLELADALDEAERAGAAFGGVLASSLERAIFEMEKGRDVANAFAEDLARLAYRLTVTKNLEILLGAAGRGLGAMFAGAGTGAPAGTTVQTNPFTGQSSSVAPQLSGGVIPAMAGQVVDDFGVLQRGGRRFSYSEGGSTTPEAIFPLARDGRGRLGVLGAGGGGGDVINMHFPSVRTAQDARAMRATLGQQVRRMRDADRRGRRGLRPRD